MRIVNGSVAMEGYSHTTEIKESHTQLNVTGSVNGVLGQRAGFDLSDALNLSKEGLNLSQSTQSTSVPQVQNTEDEWSLRYALSEKDMAKIRLLERLLEKLTGKPFKFRYLAIDLEGDKREALNFEALKRQLGSPQAPQRLGWGVSFEHRETHYQAEVSQFSTSGNVTTADGREIQFNLDYYTAHESYSETHISFKAGDALIDPLILRLDARPMQYAQEDVSFDLNLDGKTDSFRVPVDNAGFLFLDLDQNGKVTDGSELFGPKTGSGFQELATLDSDQNGWLDEGDAAFDKLRIWIHGADGSDKVLGLVEAGVGALFVNGLKGGISLKDDHFQTVGVTKANGVYLKESGQAALIHEIDLVI